MNKEIYNQDFAVYDVRKISKPNGLLMFTVKMNTDKFKIEDWVEMHEKLSKEECVVQNNLFNFDFKILLDGINFNYNISRDGIKNLISFDFCIKIGGFFDEDLFLSIIEKTKFRFNKK